MNGVTSGATAPWKTWAVAVVMLALLAALTAQTLRLSWAREQLASEQADRVRERQQATQAALAQSEAYRKLQGQQHEAIAKIDQQASARLAAARADADTAHAAGERLRHDIDNYIRAVRAAAADCTAAHDCTADAAPLILLAQLQRSADQRAGELAATADDARERGSACERAYDAARSMIEQAAGAVDAGVAENPDK